eukprot:5598379-Pyramimonas_sp.AAC.1
MNGVKMIWWPKRGASLRLAPGCPPKASPSWGPRPSNSLGARLLGRIAFGHVAGHSHPVLLYRHW